MTTHDRELEHQAAADQAERERRPAGDPAVDAYRLVARAVRQAPLPALPADFARQLAARIRKRDEGLGPEEIVLVSLMAVMCIGAALFAGPALMAALAPLNLRLPSLPWHWVIATAIGLALAAGLDRGWNHRAHH